MRQGNIHNRRSFMRAAVGLVGSGPGARSLGVTLAGLGALAAQTSGAADVNGGYKALVCVFLHGGNDSHNWVVPVDATGYAEYSSARGDLALPFSKLLPIQSKNQAAGRSFAMPEELAPLREWYQAGKLGVVANVGPLLRPISKAEAKAGVGLPSKLFSHNDQASTWQSLLPEGARSGWGGRMGDVLMSSNAYPVFTNVSTNGSAVFLAGDNVTQYQVAQDGLVSVTGLSSPWIFGSGSLQGNLRRTIAATGSNPLHSEYARVMQRSIDTGSILGSALTGVNVPSIPNTTLPAGLTTTTLDRCSLARQLSMVARLIGAGQTLGMRRQVFMVSLGGFDTHANQLRDHPALMAHVAHSINYFLSAMSTMGLLNNVTIFTASEFGRTLLSNGDGCDHGWGGHQFVAGGAVAGGMIHGRFPITATGTVDDVGSGRLLPAYSVSQMAAPMGRWLGLTDSELAMALPGLGAFDSRALQFI